MAVSCGCGVCVVGLTAFSRAVCVCGGSYSVQQGCVSVRGCGGSDSVQSGCGRVWGVSVVGRTGFSRSGWGGWGVCVVGRMTLLWAGWGVGGV